MKVHVDAAQQQISTQLSVEFKELLLSLPNVSDYIDDKLVSWNIETTRSLFVENPFGYFKDRLQIISNHGLNNVKETKDAIADYAKLLKLLKKPKETEVEFFTQKMLSSSKKKRTTLTEFNRAAQLLFERWQELLHKGSAQWYLEQLNLSRLAMVKRLKQWLEHLETLSENLSSMGIEPGWWFDLSAGQLTLENLDQIQRWTSYLQNDQGAQEISRLLGNILKASESEEIEYIQRLVVFNEDRIDNNAQDELIGLTLGRDLNNVIPGELSLLSDPDTGLLFDLKYVESQLLCFESHGFTHHQEVEMIEEESTVSQNNAGPMMICIDTSGSMSGYPEQIAKAMALYLAFKARKEKRSCYIINFSTKIDTFEISQSNDLTLLFSFLRKSFHGGTDVAPALRHAIEMMQNKTYQRSDLLIISDFVMGSLDRSMLEQIEQQRQKENHFYSLVIGSEFMTKRLHTYFDKEWIYDGSTQMINQLIKFSNQIDQITEQ